jgi:hypothetical protein
MPSQWLVVEAGTDLLARARQIQRSWERLLAEGAPLCGMEAVKDSP